PPPTLASHPPSPTSEKRLAVTARCQGDSLPLERLHHQWEPRRVSQQPSVIRGSRRRSLENLSDPPTSNSLQHLQLLAIMGEAKMLDITRTAPGRAHDLDRSLAGIRVE